MSVTVITRSQSSSVHLEDGLVVGDRDVVDQDVDAAEAADHRLHHRGDVGALRHVGDVELGVAARRLDRVDGALAARPVEIDHRDLGALGGEQLGDFLADIAAGAGDDRDLILELHVHRISLHRQTLARSAYMAAPARGKNAGLHSPGPDRT